VKILLKHTKTLDKYTVVKNVTVCLTLTNINQSQDKLPLAGWLAGWLAG